MTINMRGHVNGALRSMSATRISSTSKYVAGRPVKTPDVKHPKQSVNVQPSTDKQLQSLSIGGERILEAYRVYINDGELYSIAKADEWEFEKIPGRFRCVSLDNRPHNNYCKLVVILKDE